MSEKKEKINRHCVRVPRYNLKVCLDEVCKIAKHYEIDKDFLIAVIIGDWLTHHALAYKDALAGSDEPLLSFFASCEKHYNAYKETLGDESND